MEEILLPILTAIIGALGSGFAAYRVGMRRAGGVLGTSSSDNGNIYVRLSAEDSNRIEKIDGKLNEIIAMERTAQEVFDRGADKIAQAIKDGYEAMAKHVGQAVESGFQAAEIKRLESELAELRLAERARHE